MRVAIIGGGITGLSAARYLGAAGADVTVFESSQRLGGKIDTTDMSGRPIDAGPDAFLARVPWATELCRTLGLGDELVSPAGAGAYVYSRGRLRRIPDGLVLGVPTQLPSLIRSGVMGPLGLGRAALEPLLARRHMRDERDCVGAVIRHHFGDAVLERVVDPLLGGIYAGTADRMSLAAGAPQLGGVDIDRSMFLALRRQGRQQPPPSGQPVFYTLPAGLGRLVDVLSNSLSHTEIRLGTSVQQVSTTSTGVVVDSSSGVEIFDAAVMATPAFATAAIIAGASPEGARLLASIDHASVAMVTMIVDESALGRPLDATGLLVPRPERRFVTACSWGSTKWSHWKPDGKVVLRVSAGAIDQPGVCDLDDDTIVGAVTNDLSRLMDLRGAADEVRVTRWWRSFPQYEPGHLDLADAIDAAVGADLPGIHVTGAAMRGIGIPACIRQGTEAAVAVLERGRK